MGKYSKKQNQTNSRQFTNAEKLKDNFFANSERRRKAGDKTKGDAGYWNGGRCAWGGSHNLQEDCNNLAEFFNATASIADDVNEIKLSANETIFNQKKQVLISKIRGCINNGFLIYLASVCCIWNDYFGSFLKPFLNTFSSRLTRQLSEVEQLEPKHQKELLKLETEAKQAENEYKEAKAKFDQETDPDKKAQFLILANKAAKKAEEIKRKVKANPLANLSRFSNLDDLEVLLGGNVPKKPPISNKPNSQNTSNFSNNNSNPTTNNSDWFQENKQLILIGGAVLLVIFYLYSQKDTNEYLESNYHYNF